MNTIYPHGDYVLLSGDEDGVIKVSQTELKLVHPAINIGFTGLATGVGHSCSESGYHV